MEWVFWVIALLAAIWIAYLWREELKAAWGNVRRGEKIGDPRPAEKAGEDD